MRQASDAFLKLAEMAFESGITVGDLHIEPGSAVDGRALSELVKALRHDSKPSLHVVKSNSETLAPPEQRLPTAWQPEL